MKDLQKEVWEIALKRIAAGDFMVVYSTDPLEYARNAMDAVQKIAQRALDDEQDRRD